MRSLALISFLVALALPFAASAHTTGASWNRSVGNYTVDVGYDPVAFVADEYTRFDFLFWTGLANTGAPADFAQLWVRITNDDTQNTILATGLWHQPIGPTTLLFSFPTPGHYTLETSYRNAAGDDIAVAQFPIEVVAGSGAAGIGTYGPLLLSFIIGAGVGLVLQRYVIKKR